MLGWGGVKKGEWGPVCTGRCVEPLAGGLYGAIFTKTGLARGGTLSKKMQLDGSLPTDKNQSKKTTQRDKRDKQDNIYVYCTLIYFD